MKYIATLALLFFLTSCGASLPRDADLRDLSYEDISAAYDEKQSTLDLSGLGLAQELNMTTFISPEIAATIEVLNLSNNDIDGIIIPNMPNLKRLDLSNNSLKDADMKNLAQIKLNKTFLDLSGNPLSSEILQAVQAKNEKYHSEDLTD